MAQIQGWNDNKYKRYGRSLSFKWGENVDFKSPFADIAVVWAKNEEGRIKGVISRKRNGRIFHSRNSW